MKKATVQLILIAAAAVLFNLLFWEEKMAINCLIFDTLIIGSVFYLYPLPISSATRKWLLAAHVITMVTLVLHNTILAKLAFTATLVLWVVFVQYQHRSVFYATASGMANYLMLLPNLLQMIHQNSKATPAIRWSKPIRMLVIPLIVVIIFAAIYSNANAVFGNWLGTIGDALLYRLQHLMEWFSWARFGFLLLGILIAGGLLVQSNLQRFSQKDMQQPDQLVRTKHNWQQWQQSHRYQLLKLFMGRFANGMMALKNEHATGVISLLLLNLLLLVVNAFDIRYVWFGFSYHPDLNLSSYVHEGAGLLIFSIVLAMLVLLFFFRGNLNFYQKNKWLRMGAYAWVLQNMILVVSVLVRDSYYIRAYGLAYKRIGVLVFLLLVVAGLASLLVKIRYQRTTYFLFRTNGWIALTVLVLGSCIHWDETIAQYNIARKQSIPLDIKFLLSLSNKTLPIIDQNKDILLQTNSKLLPEDQKEEYIRSALSASEYFERRKQQFLSEQSAYSWLSWNAADASALAYFKPVSIAANQQQHR